MSDSDFTTFLLAELVGYSASWLLVVVAMLAIDRRQRQRRRPVERLISGGGGDGTGPTSPPPSRRHPPDPPLSDLPGLNSKSPQRPGRGPAHMAVSPCRPGLQGV